MMQYQMHGWLFWFPMILLLVFVLRARSRHRSRAWGSRWEDRRRPAVSPPPLDEGVRARLELVEQLESRVTELENRLDFTERLLAGRTGQE